MSLLARLAGAFRRRPARAAADDAVPWVWSEEKRVLHYPECPRARNILRANRRATGMPADVARACWRGCRVCGAKLPAAAGHAAAGDALAPAWDASPVPVAAQMVVIAGGPPEETERLAFDCQLRTAWPPGAAREGEKNG